MLSDILLIIFFIIVNGFFAGAEIAVVTARKSRIKQLMDQGSRRAAILNRFKEEPDRFLATIQIGVTLAGVIAAAIGGATAVQVIKPLIGEIPVKLIAASSEAIALGLVTILITFFLLVFGELIPKSIALSDPESVGLKTARLVERFSKIAIIFVKILTFSTNILLKPFGRKTYTGRAYVSEEEVRMLIREGREQGVFEPAEQALIHSVFEFTDMSAKEVMVPSTRMVTININTPVEDIKNILAEEQFSRYPVKGKDLNDIRGILYGTA
jgi:putative hemolysin